MSDYSAVREIGPSSKIGWKIVSFFSLEADAQRQICGDVRSYFCKESDHKNPGANYMFGCMLIGLRYIPALRDAFYDSRVVINQFIDKLSNLPTCSATEVWSFCALEKSEIWQDIRCDARDLLKTLALECNPPKKPFVLEDFIEVEGYRSPDRDWMP